MKHSLRRDFKVIAIITCLGIFIYLTRGFWRQQLRIYIMGRAEVAAEDYGINLPNDTDTVEVFTLGGNSNGDINGFLGDYIVGEDRLLQVSSILPAEVQLATLNHETLTGSDAKEVIDLWRDLRVGQDWQAMCFDPVYGLQFKRKGKIYFQTAVCWHCSGYTLPLPPLGTIQYGFDSKTKEAQKLLETLERHLPLPPEPRKVQPQKPATGITNS